MVRPEGSLVAFTTDLLLRNLYSDPAANRSCGSHQACVRQQQRRGLRNRSRRSRGATTHVLRLAITPRPARRDVERIVIQEGLRVSEFPFIVYQSVSILIRIRAVIEDVP